jgi:hypothetical protein
MAAGLPNRGARSLPLRTREEESMKKSTALVAILGIAVVGALTAGVMVACASDSNPLRVTGDVAGFSPGASFLWESQADQERDLDLMASTGAKWLRLDFPWPSIQPAATTWNWGPFDRVIALAKARNFTILALPSYTPTWAKGTTGNSPADPNTFAAFMTAAVQRYAPQGVKSWEIWNEPNQSWSWSPPDPAAYTRLLIKAYAAVKAADPTAQVLTAGLAPAADRPGQEVAPLTFVQGIYAAGGQGSFDAVAVHPYTYPSVPTDPSIASWSPFAKMADIHRVMESNGDAAKKIWLTEFGAPTGTGTGAVSEARQPDMVTQGFIGRAQWTWTGPLFWYAGRDSGTNLADREQNFGLWRNDFSAKPSAAVFAATIEGDIGISTAFTVSR